MFVNQEMGLFKHQVLLQDTNEVMLSFRLISVVRYLFPPVSGDLTRVALQVKW